MRVSLKDSIHVLFVKSNTGESYCIENNEVKVDVVNLIIDGCLEYIFRVDPGPDEINEKHIVFDCNVMKNGRSALPSIPMQIKRKGADRGR